MKRSELENVIIEYNKYIFTKDDQNITLYKLKIGNNKDTNEPTYNYVLIGYYRNIYMAAKRMLDDIDNPSSVQLQDYLREFKKVYNDLENLIQKEKINSATQRTKEE